MSHVNLKNAAAAARYLDVGLVVVATPVALALGVPALGLIVGAVAWVAQRALAQLDRRWISTSTQPKTQLGLNLFEAFGRIWLLVGAIVLAGVLGGRADGLTAAVVIFGAYSVAFVIRLLSGAPNRQAARTSEAALSKTARPVLVESRTDRSPEGGAVSREVAR
jgi:ABC-type methionine transport system permease subunit